MLYYSGEEIGENNDSQTTDDEEWPPFRRVGTFDPYSDDPRLAVKRVRFMFYVPLQKIIIIYS